jgi:hypothetical protein
MQFSKNKNTLCRFALNNNSLSVNFRDNKRFFVAFSWLVALVTVGWFSTPGGSSIRTVYKPPSPKVDKPPQTQSSASRGCQQNLTNLVTLVVPKDHIGLTVSSNPTFSYVVSGKSPVPAMLTVAEIDGRKAVIEKTLTLNKVGIESVSLPQSVKLEIGKEYVWTITLICNEVRSSKNVRLQDVIKRVTPSSQLQQQLRNTETDRERGRVYAENGIWYDAIANLKKEPQEIRSLLQ